MKIISIKTPNFLTLFLSFTLLSFYSHAQKSWVNDIHNEEKSLYEIQESFESYWEGKAIGKGKGWKPFKRREAFMAPRVYPDGIFPYEKLYEEYSKLKNQPKSLNTSDIEADWQAFGPTSVPYQNNGSKRGVGRINIVEFNPTNPNIIWVGSPSGGLWKSTDGGENWSSNTDLLPNLGVSDIAIDPTNPDIMYIITGDRDADDTYAYGLMKSTDGGQSWNTTGLSFNINNAYRGNRVLINPNNTNILLVSTRKSGYGETYRSIDGGENFEMVLQGPNFISMEYNVSNPNTVYAVTTGTSKFYRSNDNGLTWDNMTNDVGLPNSGNNRGIIGVTEANSNVVYILYSSNDDGFGGLYKSIDGGYNFTLQSETPNILSWETDGGGEGGQGWYDLALTVSPTNENIIFTGGINIWKSTNGGQDWNISSHWYGGDGVEYAHADQHILRYNVDNGILYAGNDGGLYKSENDGENWTDISDDLQITQFYKIGISQTDYGLLLGGTQDNGTLRCNSQNDWDAVRGGDGMECAVDPTNPDIMYSELYYGDIAISTNGGGNWDNIAPDSDGAWITPYQIDQNNPSRIVIGYNVVYESLDYGENWSTISTTFNGSENIDVICLSPSSDDFIYIAEGEDIFKTTDGGDNWLNISSGLPSKTITSIAVHPDNSNELWTTFSGYSDGDKVFYSTDGGDNWSNVSDNLPNLPSNTILFYPTNETLFLGTDIGVFYKDSSMTDWEIFNQGLPNVIVTELEYHISSNKLFAGTYGRGVWVTSLPPTSAPVASFNYSSTNECVGIVSFNNSSSNSVNVEWNFGDGNVSTESFTTHQYSTSGDYSVELIVSNNLGTDTITQEINIDLVEPPTASSTQSCTPTSVTLTANNNGTSNEINWYDAPLGGNLVHIGESYTTDVLNSTTTFYIESASISDSAQIGEVFHSGNSDYSGSSSSVGSLEFDANESFILESVDVFTNQAGERKIVLFDNEGNIVHEHTEDVPESDNVAHTIELNFQISAGNSYRLTTNNDVSIANFGGENPQLKRSSSDNLNFPYTYNGIVSVNGSYWYGNGGSFMTDYYYYFYNWNIKTICSSARTPVEVRIGSGESLSIDITSNCPYDSLTLNASGNFTSFEWDNSSTNQNITIFEEGTYEVIAYDSAGCAATSSIEIPSINSFEITSNENLCEGSTIYLQSIIGLESYFWNTEETSSVISINSSGTYSVTAEDENGCELFDEITIESIATSQIEIEYDLDSLVVCRGSNMDFFVSSSFENMNVVWNNVDLGTEYSQIFLLNGEQEVTVTGLDENGCSSVDTLKLTVIECETSIDEFFLNTQLFPNPNDGRFIIQHQSSKEEINLIRIIDLQSRIIEQRKVNYDNGFLVEQFDLSNLSKGLYLVELNSTYGRSIKKVVLE